eukprot:SAG22_NODE_1848_length_3446_cov_4.797132_6_plen_75_part_01
MTGRLVAELEEACSPKRPREPCLAANDWLPSEEQLEKGWECCMVRQRSSLLKAVITAFPCVSLPFLAVPLLSHRT